MLSSRKRKGQYFEIDAMVAISLLLVGIIYLRNLRMPTPMREEGKRYGEESIQLLRSVKVGELSPDILDDLQDNYLWGETFLNYTLAKQAGIYCIRGNTTLAKNITQPVIERMIPPNYGYGIWFINSSAIDKIEDEVVIYNRTWPKEDQDIGVGKTIVTAFNKNKDVTEKSLFELAMIEVRVWR